ncbi:MAG: DUF3604 domain-containing protein [Halieaceae bacterium]
MTTSCSRRPHSRLALATGFFLALLLAVLLASSLPVFAQDSPPRDYSETRQPCADHDPLRQLYWGDLHVHTRYSLDASTQDTRTTPTQAYDFARGATLGIQPWREGVPVRSMQLQRPLDFAAVTDHAELLGEVEICTNPAMAGHDSFYCRAYRWWPRLSFFMFNTSAAMGNRLGLCGDDGELCRQAAAGPWAEMQASAEQAYDRSADCQFTSFVAYEWTGASENLGNTHRNVVFRNAEVPALPISFIDSNKLAPTLYQQLDEACIEADGRCDVIVIPHNSNLSDGYMFQLRRPDGSPLEREDADTRRRFETLVELLQHKGASECFYAAGVSEDELCAFEQLPYDKFSGKFQSWSSEPPQPEDGFMREVLRDGLRQQQAIGSNPFQPGFIGSTDTHLGAAGAVSEKPFYGHGGAGVPADEEVPPGLVDDPEFNPGGLAAVWASENSRDALFDAMRRRETYATSGPRIELRLFAGADINPGVCGDLDFVAQGYRDGVPMGGELQALASAPNIAVTARRDPGTLAQPGLPLQRLQIIKGWVDAEGKGHERVYDVAGDADNGASVDLQSCQPRGPGFDQLCSVWQDPEFKAGQLAYYYARAVENPSCRWSQHICAARGVDCARPATIDEGLEGCCAAEHRPQIQERAVSSPIWYRP